MTFNNKEYNREDFVGYENLYKVLHTQVKEDTNNNKNIQILQNAYDNTNNEDAKTLALNSKALFAKINLLNEPHRVTLIQALSDAGIQGE
jgi:hypothetical protein